MGYWSIHLKKMMKGFSFIATTVFLLMALSVSATTQVPNTVRYKGEKYEIIDYDPLQPILAARSINTHLLGLTDMDTGCWRGYVADFEVLDDKLYLLRIRGCTDSTKVIDLATLFPKEHKDGKVWAWWFTGSLNIGNTPKWITLWYKNYDNEIDLFIEQGKVNKLVMFDNSKTLPSKKFYEGKMAFQAFYHSELPKEILEKINGNITFRIENSEEGNLFVSRFNDNLPSEVKDAISKVTEKIKDWPVVYTKGKFKAVSEFVFLKQPAKD